MRSVYFTEEHDAFRKTVRQFLEAEVAPHADAWEEARRIPRDIWRRLGDQGFLGILFPEAYGGTGADVFYALAFLEELPRSRMGGFCAAVSVQEFMATGAVARHGTEELKQRYLVPSIAGAKVGAICISEPDTGSDVAAIRTRAVRDGDSWVVDGAKTWITNGVEGDFYVVAVKTDPEAGAGGISLIAMDSHLPGIKASRLRKMGWHSSDTAEIVFENVRVPASGLVGQRDHGFYYIMETFAIERIVGAALAVGGGQFCLELTKDYMSSRKAFGKPIAKFQALRHRMADLYTELEAARQLTYHAAWLWQQGENAVRESSMAKMYATESNKRLVDECLQMFGGYGYVEEYPMARFYRDARVSTIVAGTTEIMREIVAKIDLDGVTFASIASREAEVETQVEPQVEPQTVAAREVEKAPEPALAATVVRPAGPGGGAFGVPPGAPEPVPAGPPASPLEQLFTTLPGRLRPERTEGWRGNFHFRFTGSATPEWTVAVDGPSCHVSRGLSGRPDCVVTTTEAVYLGIENGSVNPTSAFLMGKVKVSNANEMLRFIKSFRRAESR